jgi:3-phytase
VTGVAVVALLAVVGVGFVVGTRSGGGSDVTAPAAAPGDPSAPPAASGAADPEPVPSASGGWRGVRAVRPVAETDSFPAGEGDVADDSAIWFDEAAPGQSLLVAGNKDARHGGLAVYGLDGRQRQYLDVGRVGNVDLREGFPLGGRRVALVGANSRVDDTMRFWVVDAADRALRPVTSPRVRTVSPTYGFCLYRSPVSGTFYAFVSQDGGGRLEQYALDGASGAVKARRVRVIEVGSQSEGCVADDERAVLYVGEEDVGVWRYDAEPDGGSARTALDRVGRGRLVADVEGLALTDGPDGGRLLVSSQGDSTIAVYERRGRNRFLGRFAVGENGSVDAVRGTDGVAADSRDFGGDLSGGLVVVHDERDTGGTTSNLKLVPLVSVLGP